MKSNTLINLVARDNDHDDAYSPTMAGLLITLVVLMFLALSCVGALYVLRWRRRSASSEGLPMYEDKSSSSSSSRNQRLSSRPHESIIVYQEKQSLMRNSYAPPLESDVPEIRIHFPDEVDTTGKRQSGRVVVVRVGEHSTVGLEPVASDNLPPYQKSDSDRFQSLDLESIGGLTEKEVEPRWQ